MNQPNNKARDLTIIAIVCNERDFQDIVKQFEFAEPRHKRYTLFKRIIDFNQARGQRWDGYIKLNCSSCNERSVDNVVDDFETRGVKELKIVRTEKGPIIVLPEKKVIS